MSLSHRILTILLSCLFVATLSAQEWTRFRGPNGSGLSATVFPTRWTPRDYRWQVKLPGGGHSSPVVWGERLFITSGNAQGQLHLVCLDCGTGRTLWQREYATGLQRRHQDNSVAAGSPAVDGKHVYICWGNSREVVLIALTHEGKEVWRRDLGPYRGGHGFGSSPIVLGQLVILPCEKDGKDNITALDSDSGAIRWRLPRNSRNTYATPCLFHPPGRPAELILVNYEDGIASVDPETGRLNWVEDVFDKEHIEASIASPVVQGDLVLGTAGWLSVRYETVALRPGQRQQGKLTPVWKLDKVAPLVPTPLIVGELLFLVHDRGVASCVELATGKVLWRERVPGSYYGSPVCAGKHIYCLSREGDLVVLAAARQFEHVATINLGEGSHATPAISGGRMFLRTYTQVLCLEAQKPQAP